MKTKRDASLVLELHNAYGGEMLFEVRVHWGTLPDGAALHAGLAEPDGAAPHSAAASKGRGRAAHPRERDELRVLLERHRGASIRPDRLHFFRLEPDERRTSVLPAILLDSKRPALLAVKVVTEVSSDRPAPRFDLVQIAGKTVVGGCTVVVAHRPPE